MLGDRAALLNRTLWVFLVANTLQGLAFFIPPLYLPSTTVSCALEPR